MDIGKAISEKVAASPALASAKASVASATATVADVGSKATDYLSGERSTYQTTEDVLRSEYIEIWGADLPDGETYNEAAQRKNPAALCLSGGGIRSAAFSLGVLQALASRKLLTQFHYLSTVSGGGYIGGWLSRWIATIDHQDAAEVERVLGLKEEILQISNLRANSNFLTPKTGITSADTWTAILLWIRNVLLNWTVFIPALLFAVLAANLYQALVTWVAALGQQHFTVFDCNLASILLVIGSLCLVFATWQAAWHLPSHRDADASTRAINWLIVGPLLFWAALMPLVLMAGEYKAAEPPHLFRQDYSVLTWLLVFSFGAKIVGYVLAGVTTQRNRLLYLKNILTWIIVSAIATGALWLAVLVIDQLAAFVDYLSALLPAKEYRLSDYQPLKDHLLKSAGELGKGGGPLTQVGATIVALSIFGPLGATLAHLLLSTLYVGFRFTYFQDDADREWLARVSAICVFPALIWAVFAFICLFLPFVLIDNEWLVMLAPTFGPAIDKLTAVFGIVSGFIAVLGGKSASVKLDITNAAPKPKSTKAYELLVRAATLFFIACIFVVLAYAERMMAEKLVSTAQSFATPRHDLPWIVISALPRVLVFLAAFGPVYLLWLVMSRETPRLWLAMGLLFAACVYGVFAEAMGLWVIDKTHIQSAQVVMAQAFIAAGLFFIVTITSARIDVNRFSMHGVYRNRLVRAFLGGARASRAADPFTNFDPADNYRVSELNAQKGGNRVLYPVINVTLNLVGGTNLAWQERKASSFVITPCFCGSATLGAELPRAAGANNPRRWEGAYIETQNYGGKEPDLSNGATGTDTGISLGTAITISGAAASPSMGYNSAPATAFLMTMFNVRLGAWLANPAAPIQRDEVKAGPTSALKPLLTEALGLTDSRSANIYLSDGGHFDNLGLYEMIRRRCRFILVLDAGADEKFYFEDLARSVRFAAIDLDADVSFDSVEIKNVHQATATSATFAVGKIVYSESPTTPGWLVYIKPTYFYERAPVDVRSYGSVNDTFPHETTLDQWFSESQFESYRRLGEYLMEKLYTDKAVVASPTMQQFFNAARVPAAVATPPPSAAAVANVLLAAEAALGAPPAPPAAQVAAVLAAAKAAVTP